MTMADLAAIRDWVLRQGADMEVVCVPPTELLDGVVPAQTVFRTPKRAVQVRTHSYPYIPPHSPYLIPYLIARMRAL